MRLGLVANPGSGTSEQMDLLRPLLADLDATLYETTGPNTGAATAQAAARDGVTAVVACGGDGTINEVVNGLMALPKDDRPVFGVVPMGTGNDLARTLGLPLDPRDALATVVGALADPARLRPLDVFRFTAHDTKRWGVNMAAGGFSGTVGEAMSGEMKARWGPLAYLAGAVRALPALTPFAARLVLDGERVVEGDVYNVFVANGQYVAGGKLVSDVADPFDGCLDVVVVRAGSAAELAALAARFVAGQHHDSPLVETYCAQEICIDSTPGMLFNIDGELLTDAACAIALEPGALRCVVGHLGTSREAQQRACGAG